MKKFRDYLKQTDNTLNEIKITELKDIETEFGSITWNKNKSFNKFKNQIEDRIRLNHVTEEFFYKILQKGINSKFTECYNGTLSVEDDTCLVYTRSQFLVIFNRKGKFIRSIRKYTDLDKIMCKSKKQLFEVKYGSDNELTRFLEELDVNLDKNDEGYRFDSVLSENKDEMLLEVHKLCQTCIQLDL